MMKALMASFLFFVSGSVYGASRLMGGVDGGGGVGVRCGQKLEALDLHEARLAGRTPGSSAASKQEAIDLVTELLAEHFWTPDSLPPQELAKTIGSLAIEPFFDGRSLTNPATNQEIHIQYVDELPLASDIGKTQIEPCCQLEQIAYFNDENSTIYIVKAKWDQLNWTDRAALAAHEFMYWQNRHDSLDTLGASGPMTSEKTREFVGRLFSSQGTQPIGAGIPQTGYLKCTSLGGDGNDFTYFFAHPEQDGHVAINLTVLKGHFNPYLTTASFAGAPIADWTNDEATFDLTVPLSVADQDSPPQIRMRLSKAVGGPVKVQSMVEIGGGWTNLGEQEFLCTPK